MYHTPGLALMEPEEAPLHLHSARDEVAVRKLTILLAEDLYADAMLTKIALDATRMPYALSRIRYGNEVLSHLRARKRLCPGELPDLILLDLGLPGMDGFDILADLTQAPADIRAIPLVILTAHQHFEYLRKAYPSLHILDYITKPCASEKMKAILMRVHAEIRCHPFLHARQ